MPVYDFYGEDGQWRFRLDLAPWAAEQYCKDHGVTARLHPGILGSPEAMHPYPEIQECTRTAICPVHGPVISYRGAERLTNAGGYEYHLFKDWTVCPVCGNQLKIVRV
jgi:hypothetical protein